MSTPTKNIEITPYSTAARSADRGGYSLVELMVGIMILGIVLASTFAGMKQGFFLLENTRANTQVAQVLQDEMENLRAMNWSSIEALSGESEFFESYDGYMGQRAISTLKEDQLQVVLSVSWTDTRGIEHLSNYISNFTKEGLNDFYSRTY